MVNAPRLLPAAPQLFRAHVVSSVERSPSFRRVRIRGEELRDFDWQRRDHWFRLFTPVGAQTELRLPGTTGATTWYPAYLCIPAAQRPNCSNYSVADFDAASGTMDIDVVMHRHGGAWGGAVARWAAEAAAGSPLGLLDQGVLFNPPADADELLLVCDESGWPGVRGILESLPPAARGLAVVEVPHRDDHEPVPAPAGIRVERVTRGAPGDRPGTAALARFDELAAPSPNAYGYAVGEQRLAAGARRLLHRRGVAKSRIFFSGFWRHAGH